MTTRPETPLARTIIETVGAHGTPPLWGFQLFSVGLDDILDVLDEEYLAGYLKTGGAAFKMVVGAYGGGKTHFLYSVRERAWQRDFVVAYVSLSAEESPFHKLDRVYRAVALNLMPPVAAEELLAGADRGIAALLRLWCAKAHTTLAEHEGDPDAFERALADAAEAGVAGIESTSYQAALRLAFRALLQGDTDAFEAAVTHLTAEGHDPQRFRAYGILRPIDRAAALSAIRALTRFVRNLGYAGLVVLFDEAEQVPSLSSKQREMMLANLRELIDECGHAALRHTLIVYAIPDDHVFDGATAVYEALRQRIAPVFDVYNPSGVRIRLEALRGEPVQALTAIGERLRDVFEAAYGVELPAERARTLIRGVAAAAYEQRFGDVGYRRLYVQGVIRGFQRLRREPQFTPGPDWARQLVDGAATP